MTHYNLNLTTDAEASLNRLMAKTEDPNMTEVLRKALATYDLITDVLLNGGEIYAHDSDGNTRKIDLAGFAFGSGEKND